MTTPIALTTHEIVLVPSLGQFGRDELLEQCYSVRTLVFHQEQGFPLETEIDDFDQTATHFLLRAVPSLKPFGTVRVIKLPNSDYYKLSRLAVLKDRRQCGFGRQLVEALHAWVKHDAKTTNASDIACVAAHSQMPVRDFYARLGYNPDGPIFMEEGAPHQLMKVKLPLDHINVERPFPYVLCKESC